jgi:hypothetical protein
MTAKPRIFLSYARTDDEPFVKRRDGTPVVVSSKLTSQPGCMNMHVADNRVIPIWIKVCARRDPRVQAPRAFRSACFNPDPYYIMPKNG